MNLHLEELLFAFIAIGLCFGPALSISFIPLLLDLDLPEWYPFIAIPIIASGPLLMIFVMNKIWPDTDEVEEAYSSQW